MTAERRRRFGRCAAWGGSCPPDGDPRFPTQSEPPNASGARQRHHQPAVARGRGGDAPRFAWKAAEYGADLVVAAGGDGTINEVVNGLYEWSGGRPDGACPLPRLGIVPMGTANDLAGGLGIASGDPEGALAIAVAGMEYVVDVGRVNGRYFLNVSTG